MRLSDIIPAQPFPFVRIPHQFFEQSSLYQQYTFSAENLAHLRAAVDAQAANGIEEQSGASHLEPQSQDVRDWIFALNYLERLLPGGRLSYDHLSAINYAFTKEESLRTEPCAILNLNQMEALFFNYYNRLSETLEYFKDLHKDLELKFEETPEGIFENRDTFLRAVDTCYFSTTSIKTLFSAINNWKQSITNYSFDCSQIDSWENEQQGESIYKKGYLHIPSWQTKRQVHFPPPEDLEKLLTTGLKQIYETLLHPIEMAALLWVDICKMRPYKDGNERTARAAGSFLLMANGFQPPLITTENVERYKEVLAFCIEHDTYEPFVQFLAQLLIEQNAGKKRVQFLKQPKIIEIEPFSTSPFRHIPVYLYGQVDPETYNSWLPAQLEQLKKATMSLTANALNEVDNKTMRTHITAACNWVYALNFLEEMLILDLSEITVEKINELNARLRRFSPYTESGFRKSNVNWCQDNLNSAETLLFHHRSELFALKRLNLTKDGFLNTQEIYNLFKDMNEGKIALINHTTRKLWAVEDIKAPLYWEREQRKNFSYKKGYIDLQCWLEERTFTFPSPAEVPHNIAKIIELIKCPNIHPLIKALKVWYMIVECHPWPEANKRTAYLLAMLILLKHGYLPPLFTPKNSKRYSESFLHCFFQSNGLDDFITFMAGLIYETQVQFEGLPL